VFSAGNVVLAEVHFTDTNETKVRPCVVLFEELGNIVVAGITSNKEMKGIPLKKSEGAIKDSVIKLNYIFTLSPSSITKVLFNLSNEKKLVLFAELVKRLNGLNSKSQGSS
jgi:mRNA interferase MazF